MHILSPILRPRSAASCTVHRMAGKSCCSPLAESIGEFMSGPQSMERTSMNWSLDDEALQKQLMAVAHYFELGSLLSSHRAGGYANTTYFVTTNKGEYVIKWLLPAKLEKLQQEWLYLQRLQLHGFPAVSYVQAPHDAFIYQKGNEIAVAMKKLPGHHSHPTKEV